MRYIYTMIFDPENEVVKLCAEGVQQEGDIAAAGALYTEAWQMAANNLEKCIAAHYLARAQFTPAEKMKWNMHALEHALNITDGSVNSMLPSLHLNLGKDYEDAGDITTAKKQYLAGMNDATHLQEDGYGKMIQSGLSAGLERLKQKEL